MSFAFDPNWTISPGQILRDYMEERECLVSDVTRITGFQEKDIEYILAGEKKITPYISLKLSMVFGVKSLWFYRLQEKFDADVAAGKNLGILIREAESQEGNP